MSQSNALRLLESILDGAIRSKNLNQSAGIVLLNAMNLPNNEPKDIVDFYEILNKAEEETIKLNHLPKVDRYIQAIHDLHKFFVVNHVWNAKWNIFADYIENRNVLTVLDLLANFYHVQNRTVFLENDFLEKLKVEVESLRSTVLNSNLSKELKNYLINKIEDILQALRRYSIDGTEGIEKTAKSLVTDLLIIDNKIKNDDKNNVTYKRFKAFFLSLVLFIRPSVYDIMGVIPDIKQFWIPTIEELTNGKEKIEKLLDDGSSIQAIVEKASEIFSIDSTKKLSGKEQKSLPPSKENTFNTEDKQ
ncbi:hypothetical protein NOS3756_42600 [Nostoc sp. NIES-3756]|uniref:hypothetical protein n=1 Tax=Nostoc sp. NIES-3756 TaxID=1751286 RepID=UPI000720AA78|nr:hypothetical protein [Nostoc sp. NIES-3756]BAT55281.1 hypothetical protein NOS3756_42600 [Nostoc sp. NIES-3756]